MKCIDCEHYDQIKLCCKFITLCDGRNRFEPKEGTTTGKLVQAEKTTNAVADYEEVLKRVKGVTATSMGYEEGLRQAKYISEFPFNKPSAIELPQIVRMSLQGYENLTNMVGNQNLEIKNLKYAIEDMNSKLLKKNKEINELQAVIKTLGGLL